MLFIAFAAVSIVMSGLAIRAIPVDALVRWIGFACAALAIGTASFVLYRRASRARLAQVVTERPAPGPVLSGPYRGHARRIGRRLAPPVSGRMATAVVAAMLGLTAAIVPSVFSLPRLVEIEIVLLGWWLVWTITFAVLLHQGWRVARDARHRVRPEGEKLGLPDVGVPDIGGDDGEGCAVVLAIAALVIVALLASWLLIELVVPALAVAIYALILRGLARVANDTHGCEGSPLRAMTWGAIWAAVYTLPLAIVVGIVHALQ